MLSAAEACGPNLTCEFLSHIVDEYSFVIGSASSQIVAMEAAASTKHRSTGKEHPVSIHHASADTSDQMKFVQVRALLEATTAAIANSVGTLRAAIVNRWTARRIERLSDHMLRDFGFERDWDGTIRAARDAD
jgi:hypothetical protein